MRMLVLGHLNNLSTYAILSFLHCTQFIFFSNPTLQRIINSNLHRMNKPDTSWKDLNDSLVAGSSSRTGAGLAGLSTACYRVSIETSLTALTPRPGGVMETLLLVRKHTNKEDMRSREQLITQHLLASVCFHMLRFAKSPLVHSTAEIKAVLALAKDLRKKRRSIKTYQTAAWLWVTAAGMTIAVAPLTSAQVKARAWPGVTLIALLQRHGKTPQVRDKWWQRGICLCSTAAGRQTAIISKDCNGKKLDWAILNKFRHMSAFLFSTENLKK